MTYTIRNLTPHAIVLVPPGQAATVRIAPDGVVARLVERSEPSEQVVIEYGQDVVTVPVFGALGDVVGLPDPETGVLLLVSSVVLAACPERHDLVAPTDFTRHADGTIAHARGLRSYR